MNVERNVSTPDSVLVKAAAYGAEYRQRRRPVHPSEDAESLRRRFCRPLGEEGRDSAAVIDDLIAACEPGLVGNTDAAFFSWVMGGSNTTGVAADWLTSVWGQNAAIYQTSPAAAIAEEAVAEWLLDLLDMPRESSVGLVTGATMAGFVCLAAARAEVLARAGYDLDRRGLQGAPLVRIYLSDDAHVSNLLALRFLGFGDANLVRVPSDSQGLMQLDALGDALCQSEGPRIIVGQAGHINSGGFDDFEALSQLAERHGSWLHIDGAFGLWTRVLPEKRDLTFGLDRADSWSVDGHKWLQIPYDSGFAIVRNAASHRRAMENGAAYLTHSQRDGRNPSEFNPELSRRARGFAAWSVFQALGRSGIRSLVRRHCDLARSLAERIAKIEGLTVCNRVDCNQVAIACVHPDPEVDAAALTQELTDRLNATGEVFVRTTVWKGSVCLRISVISGATDERTMDALADRIASVWNRMNDELSGRAHGDQAERGTLSVP